jgi:hypothetical protein
MKKQIEVSEEEFNKEDIKRIIEKKADTSKEYYFKRTYVGMLGAFHKGEKYFLSQEQYDKLKEDIK